MNPGEPWVRKPQDTMNNIQEELSFYKKNMLLSLEVSPYVRRLLLVTSNLIIIIGLYCKSQPTTSD